MQLLSFQQSSLFTIRLICVNKKAAGIGGEGASTDRLQLVDQGGGSHLQIVYAPHTNIWPGFVTFAGIEVGQVLKQKWASV